MGKFNLFLILTFTLFLQWGAIAYSDDAAEVERHVRSAFVYQFTKLVEWPSKPGDFVIDIIEDDELIKVLSGVVAEKTVGGRKIKVQSAKWADILAAVPDIVVMPKGETSFHKSVISKLKGKPCLVVTYADGLGAAGATINFFLLDGKMKIEVNMGAATENSLTVDKTILKLGKVLE